MRLLIRSFLVAVFIVGLMSGPARSQTPPQTQANPATPQAPPRDAKAAKKATGVIKGRVVAADTGALLRGARVSLMRPGSAERPLATVTDAQGHYEFTELEAGRYTLTASRGAYVTLQYGQRRAFEGGKPIDLAEGATLEKMDFALPKGAVIAGTVVDEIGEPAVGVRVTAMRSRYEEGKRKLLPVGHAADTNDLGQYRIYGLQPGTYFVGTQPLSGPLAALLAGGGTDELALSVADSPSVPPSYYPGTLNPSDAGRVTLRIGQERSGTDFVQLSGRMARISGVVVDAQGAHPQGMTSVVLMNPSNITSMNTSQVKPDGSFTISNVAPGEYMLMTTAVTDMAAGQMQMAMVRVTVVGEDIQNLTVSLSPGARVTGRVVLEDGTPPPFPAKGVRVDSQQVQSDVPVRMTGNVTALGTVKDDWTFDWNGLGGTFLFRARQLPSGYYLKSVLLDGRDITDTPLDIKGTDDVNGLQVVLTTTTTEVSGTPIDEKGQPAINCTVVVFADDAAKWKYPSRFLTTARPDEQGHFTISDLPPGRYLAAALEYLEQGQGNDPDYLETLRPLATMFTLSAGEKKTLELRVARPEGFQ